MTATALSVELATKRWGTRGGPRVLLVHGVQSAANTWWRVAGGLAGAGAHVVAPDLRGHGGSPSAPGYRLGDLAADLQALGGGWDLVAGHSLGATVLAQLLTPDFARRAVLLEPVLELPEDGFDALVAGQLAELELTAAAIAAANPRWDAEDCRLKAIAARACSPAVNAAVLHENRPWDHAGAVAAARVPTLVVGGRPEGGAMLAPATGRRLAAGSPTVRYVQLDTGHSPHRDAPDRVVALLRRELGA